MSAEHNGHNSPNGIGEGTPSSSEALLDPTLEHPGNGHEHPEADTTMEPWVLAEAETAETDTTLPPETFRKFYNPSETYIGDSGDLRVHVESDVTLEDVAAVTPAETMDRFIEQAEALEGKKVVSVNATSAGGGVAIMRAPGTHLAQEAGVDWRWHALRPDKEAAKITKWIFHNGLQGVAPDEVTLTQAHKDRYEEWIRDQNVEALREDLAEADVIVLDDSQSAALMPFIKGYDIETEDGIVHVEGINPDAPIIYRNHIQTRADLMVQEGNLANDIWEYQWEELRLKEADIYVAHPVPDEFVPDNIPNEKVVLMPATYEKLDDLNRDLEDWELEAGREWVNEQLATPEQRNQLPINFEKPYYVLIARFDESKGMPQGIESFVKHRQELLDRGVDEDELPQLVVIGNGSVDDPSGDKVHQDILDLVQNDYSHMSEAIKVLRVPHNDLAINAVLTGAKLALQPSIREGFEHRVTEAIAKGVPVLGSNRGGIPLQIIEGESGYIIDPYDTDTWARRMTELATDEDKYNTMREQTLVHAKNHNDQFTTVVNMTNWFFLCNQALNNREGFNGNRRWVSEMVTEEREQKKEQRARQLAGATSLL